MKQTLFLLSMFVGITHAAVTVDQILDSVEANEQSQTSRVEMTQTVHKANGSKSVSELVSYSADKGDKAMMEYVKPARIQGMKILQLNDGDDIWSYFPRTKRVRKIASHQKNQSVNGSDFSYEDMNTGDRREDYSSKLLGEENKAGVACYKIEMKPKAETKTSYSKMVMWVEKGKWLPVVTEYYDEYNELWKILTISNVTKIGKYWSPGHIEMKNVQKGTRTVMTQNKTEYDIDVDMNMFTERYLSR